jgi:diguanylate cyclase (GGDEF)-like protein
MLSAMDRLRRNAEMLSEETRAAKSQLSCVHAQYKLILETIADAIVVLDKDHRVSYLNPRACGVFAIRGEDAVGQLLEKDSRFGRMGDLCIEAAERLGGWNGETSVENAEDGHIHNIYHARFFPIAARDAASSTLVVLEDVTREEMLKRQIRAQAERLEVAVEAKTIELRTANEKLKVLARTDSLTGLANRRMFEDILAKETSRALRNNQPISIIVIDIDGFKKVNDVYGHQKGDDVLAVVSKMLHKSVRESDTLARWGGDEFIILLPQDGLDSCKAVAERIRRTFAAESPSLGLGQKAEIGLSIGWASGAPDDATTIIANADEMMYERKRRKKERSAR